MVALWPRPHVSLSGWIWHLASTGCRAVSGPGPSRLSSLSCQPESTIIECHSVIIYRGEMTLDLIIPDQSQLDFLPERSTDFIFAVFAEEFGMMGAVVLLLLYAFIIWRGLYIADHAQDNFSRLLAGSLSMTFFVYLFVNVGMVSGVLPVNALTGSIRSLGL